MNLELVSEKSQALIAIMDEMQGLLEKIRERAKGKGYTVRKKPNVDMYLVTYLSDSEAIPITCTPEQLAELLSYTDEYNCMFDKLQTARIELQEAMNL